jgi:uncharacterized protein YkwD
VIISDGNNRDLVGDVMRFISGRAAILAVAAGCLLSMFASWPASAQETGTEQLRNLALELVNKDRAANNLPALRLEAKLTKAAQSHADDMLRRDYYSHYSPEGKAVSDRYQAAGGNRWLLTAENIAQCTGCKPPLGRDYVREMQEGWMNSPGHRANILRKGLTEFGYGMVIGKGGTLYAVQTFSGPGTSQGDNAGADATELAPHEQLSVALEEINRKRKTKGVPPLLASEPLSEAAQSMLPEPGAGTFEVRRRDDIYNTVPKAARNNWNMLTALIASCGGCGLLTVKADAVFFTGRWLDNKDYGPMLMDAKATHIGFAMAADGQGKKIGVGLLGKGQ